MLRLSFECRTAGKDELIDHAAAAEAASQLASRVPVIENVDERYFLDRHSAVALFAGSVQSVLGRSIALLVANLNAITIRRLAGEVARVLEPSGRAVLAGFARSEMEPVRHATETHGLSVEDSLERDGWICLLARHRP